jgi:hypothetical protein
MTANVKMKHYTMLVCPLSCLLSAIALYAGGRSLNKETEKT